jgi:hypothetical protein
MAFRIFWWWRLSGSKCRSLRAVGSVLQREVVLSREAGPIDHSAAQLLGKLYGPSRAFDIAYAGGVYLPEELG